MASRPLTVSEITALIRKHFPPLSDAELKAMVAIALAESSGNPSAIGPKNKNGTTDYGLFQVNSIHWGNTAVADRLDPDKNTAKAAEVYRKQGKNAWVAHKNGKAAGKLVQVEKEWVGGEAIGVATGSALTIGGAMGGLAGAGPTAIAKALDPGAAILNGLNSFNETLAKFFNSFALWVIAVVLIILGIVILLRKPVAAVAFGGKAAAVGAVVDVVKKGAAK